MMLVIHKFLAASKNQYTKRLALDTTSITYTGYSMKTMLMRIEVRVKVEKAS